VSEISGIEREKKKGDGESDKSAICRVESYILNSETKQNSRQAAKEIPCLLRNLNDDVLVH
jgi:hypothetical protein